MLLKSYAEIYQCSYLCRDNRHYIHLVYTMLPPGGASSSSSSAGERRISQHHQQQQQQQGPNRQQIRCETKMKAETVVHHVNYAKTLFEERQLMISPMSRDVAEDDEFSI